MRAITAERFVLEKTSAMSVDWLRFDGAGRALAGQAWASQTSFAGADGLSSPAWGDRMGMEKSKDQNPKSTETLKPATGSGRQWLAILHESIWPAGLRFVGG
jgi:hypothetical protein